MAQGRLASTMVDGSSGDDCPPLLPRYRHGVFVPKTIAVAVFDRSDALAFHPKSNIGMTWCANLICRLLRKRVILSGHGILADNVGFKDRLRSGVG